MQKPIHKNTFLLSGLSVLFGFLIAILSNLVFDVTKNTPAQNLSNANTAQELVKNKPQHEPEFLNLSFIGDIMLDRGVESSVIKNFGGDFSRLFDNLGRIKEADILFGNLEGTASDKGKDLGSIYSFRMNPETLEVLSKAGFDVLSLANNHVGDWGRASFEDTLAGIKTNEMHYTGAGMNSLEAETPTIIEKNGIRLGFLGFADNGPEYLAVGENSPGFLSTKNERFAEIIKKASEMVDYLVVSFHFGEEYETTHNTRQEYLARTAVDNGAKIVVGHHPHVIQDTEIYKNGFIAYSLGNFIFDQYFSENTMQGMLLEVKLHKNGNLDVKENIIKLNRSFQPEEIIEGESKSFNFE